MFDIMHQTWAKLFDNKPKLEGRWEVSIDHVVHYTQGYKFHQWGVWSEIGTTKSTFSPCHMNISWVLIYSLRMIYSRFSYTAVLLLFFSLILLIFLKLD